VLLALALLLPTATSAGAQEAQTATTTSTTTTTTTAPPDATTTTAPPPGEPPPVEDAVPEAAPPPPDGQAPPTTTPADPAADPRDAALDEALYRMTAGQLKRIARARVAIDHAAARLTGAQTRLTELEGQVHAARVQRDRAARQVERTKLQLRKRAVAAYTGERMGLVQVLLHSEDINQLSRRTDLIAIVVKGDRQALKAYQRSRDAFQRQTEELGQARDEQRELVVEEAALQASLADDLDDLRRGMSAVRGIRLRVGEFVFPVEAPHAFGDSWGAPRMMGTPYAHFHQGIDIFAAPGTPLLACVRGTITRLGTDVLGGTKLWLLGEDGTAYYYAHLSGYAPDLQEGQTVEAGQPIGFVGDTGNARGGLPHLHFQVHPGSGEPINPYPILRAVEEADRAALQQAVRA